MSLVIYARVSNELKEAVDKYADEHDETLAAAVSDLLERGLAVESAAPSVADLESKLATASLQKTEVEVLLRATQRELQPLQLLSDRTQQTLGQCPNADCLGAITGYDLLVTGHCKSCNGALTDLLRLKDPQSPMDGESRSRQGGVSDRDFLLLMGALGAVLGVAYLASKSWARGDFKMTQTKKLILVGLAGYAWFAFVENPTAKNFRIALLAMLPLA
jgi:hypothetical protein